MEEVRYCFRCKKAELISQYDPKKKKNNPTILKKICRSCCRELGKLASKNRKETIVNNWSGRDYSSRQINLARIGFPTYKEYLASQLWSDIRKKVFAIKGSKCYLCGIRATELHHNRYHRNDLIGKRLTYIHPICRGCHQKIEIEDEKKLSLTQAKTRFNRLRKQFRKGRLQ